MGEEKKSKINYGKIVFVWFAFFFLAICTLLVFSLLDIQNCGGFFVMSTTPYIWSKELCRLIGPAIICSWALLFVLTVIITLGNITPRKIPDRLYVLARNLEIIFLLILLIGLLKVFFG